MGGQIGHVGFIGDSQGSISVINAITNTDHRDICKAAVALSPANQTAAFVPGMLCQNFAPDEVAALTRVEIAQYYEDYQTCMDDGKRRFRDRRIYKTDTFRCKKQL